MTSIRTKYRKINNKLKNKELVRVFRGVYINPARLVGLEGDFLQATLICGKKSVICLHSALKYHELTEQMFGGIWILVPYERTPQKSKLIHVVRSRKPQFEIGIIKKKNFNITNIERTIVDCLRYSKQVGITTFVDALKKAISENLTSKEKILHMAIQLQVDKKIIPYLEVL